MKKTLLLVLVIALALTACTGSTPTPTPAGSKTWMEEEISFPFGPSQLYGILTRPPGTGPYPAVAIISGSVNPSNGKRDGAMARYHVDHARKLALEGYAVLRYDPPGVGRSTGQAGFESLDQRREEAMAALGALQTRSEIRPDRIGLWADSQGAWVIEMAAATYPQEVAFLIAVSGSAVPVAEQQVYSIEAQSENAGFSETDIAKAALFGRLLIDWQLVEPRYRQVNTAEAARLGDGPWANFMALVYNPGNVSPAEELQKGISILQSIEDEPWARYLYLRQVTLPQLESIRPEQVSAVKAVAGQTLLNDPRDYLTRVTCPVLAVFGENDLLQPTAASAPLIEQYLMEAGNESFQVVVIPGAGHGIGVSTPGYWDALAHWLDDLYTD